MKHKFELNSEEKFLTCNGADFFVFNDNYPSGHQGGVNMILHDRRLLNGGDVRFEQTPGQWQPTPSLLNRECNKSENSVTASLHYPDEKMHLTGFNPLIYPDLVLDYKVKVTGMEGSVKIDVIMDTPIPKCLEGKACFNMEIYPGHVIGKGYVCDDKSGIFPPQPNGPTVKLPANIDLAGVYDKTDKKADLDKLVGDRTYYSPIIGDDIIAKPYVSGHTLTVCPESDECCFTIASKDVLLNLYDGRLNHNNGWFVINSLLPSCKTGNILTWVITPRIRDAYSREPVVSVSQVGYHNNASKVAVLECDKNHDFDEDAKLIKVTPDGQKEVLSIKPTVWGDMLRYKYALADFSKITDEGLYFVSYNGFASSLFRISTDIYERGVWQPYLEYFLPVQMCHMQVREKYRIWHGHCHKDDAKMAPLNYNHYDGYTQGPDSLCKYKPGEHVPGLNRGGWHDAGDYDLRIESQATEVYNLCLAVENFNAYYDTSTIDQDKHLVEIHCPDGKNDFLEQIEHGLLTIIGGYEALGRLYKGIICNDLRQYVLLGDGANMTDGEISDDDRWVFTEDNPDREFEVAGQLAAAYRCMKGFNDELAAKSLSIARSLYDITKEAGHEAGKVSTAVELFLSTGEAKYKDYILKHFDAIKENFKNVGWIVARALDKIDDASFTKAFKAEAKAVNDYIEKVRQSNPYGVFYKAMPWGAGWMIQSIGSKYYFLYKAFPDVFDPKFFLDSLNFILGVHPGSNNASFASGVGTKSATVAYCANRADNTYIPGGVCSGVELIAPNFPEYLQAPFIWQQSEYVLGGGASDFVLLVLEAIEYYK